MTGQHEPLWKSEWNHVLRKGKLSCFACGTRHDVPMSYQGMKRTHDNNTMVYICH